MPDSPHQPAFVLAAQLTGRLYSMLQTARTMSISSSNAKSISIRGGDKTAGFKPITEFISDMAKDTISISSQINKTALQFSITAVSEKRALSAYNSFINVKSRLDQAEAQQLEALIQQMEHRLGTLRAEQFNYCKYLESLFDDISRRIRATGIIVINSRTEASRAGEYRANLFSIADDLEQCSQSITDDIKVCKTYLKHLTEMIGHK